MALLGLPTNPIGLYWESYYGAQARITTLPQQYNIIFLFQALPSGATGSVVFQRGGTTATLNADIATCRARGQRIIMTCGGSGAQITINSQATADNFVASIKAENVLLGGSGTTAAIDGVDFNNFEGASAGTATPAWMTYAAQQLKTYYGSGFLVTAPPSCTNYLNQRTSDRLLLATMYNGGALDWFCPQFYDGPGNNDQAAINDALDFYNTAVTVNGSSVQIPRTKMGIGFRVDAATYSWTPANAATAYTTTVSNGRTPKGAFNFSANNNPTNTFATTVAPVITNNIDPVVNNPAFSLALSSQFANGAVTTAQLTAPVSKTTSNFQGGTINETSNPAATLDLASGKYTELEWCIIANTDSVNATQYEFQVTYNGTALDLYSVTPKWTIGTPAIPPDTTAPTVPTNLVATTSSSVQIDLTWTGSTDAVGVTGYNVYRDDVYIATTTSTSYNSVGLTASTNYVYKITAIDAAANESAKSTSANATTSAAPSGDVTLPTVTITAPISGATVSGSAITLSATATDNVGVVGVQFRVGGSAYLLPEDTSNPYSVVWDSIATGNGNGIVTISATARDAAGNVQTASLNVNLDNSGAPPIVPDAPKRAMGLVSITGVLSITL